MAGGKGIVMDRYISGDKLLTAYHVVDIIEDMYISGEIVNIISVEIKNNILKFNLFIPGTIFVNLDSIELDIIYVPDRLPFGLGNQQIEKAFYQNIIKKFYGREGIPQPEDIQVVIRAKDRFSPLRQLIPDEARTEPIPSLLQKRQDNLWSKKKFKKFTDPKFGEPRPADYEDKK